jgi:RNA polymerase sigma factor (sigma-70 family)
VDTSSSDRCGESAGKALHLCNSREMERVTEEDLGELLRFNGKIWRSLRRFALELLKDAFEAEDVVQELSERLLRAMRNGTAIERRGFFKYCHVTAYRLCLNRLKGSRHLGFCLASGDHTADFDDAAANVPDSRIWTERAEAQIVVRKALGELPNRERLVIELTLRDMNDTEIATQIGLHSSNHVRQIRYRALQALRAMIAEDLVDCEQ